jgi:hypothetical protein
VVCNAFAAVALFQLCLTFGLTTRGAWLASTMSALGFGSLYTLHDSYTADPLMYAIGPAMTGALVRGRIAVAGTIGTVGVLAKEFAAAPLFIYSACAALERRWAVALRTLTAANLALIVWLVLQFVLMLRFNYGYGDNPSTHLLTGGYLAPWLAKQSIRGAASAMFNEYGAVYLLAPAGFLFATPTLQRLAIVSLPVAILFAYVQQPDRALWNFHYLALPLAALVLDRAPQAVAWSTVAAFALANLRVGAQLPVPAAKFAFAASLLLAAASTAAAFRTVR